MLERPLYLYGRGKLGKLAQDFFGAVGIPVAGSFENDEPCPTDCQVAICIVSAPYEPIAARLRKRGIDNIAPFYDLAMRYADRHPLANGWLASPPEYAAVSFVYNHWADAVSVAHYTQFLAWRTQRKEVSFDGAPLTPIDDRYFIPEICEVVNGSEHFLDCGAYLGEASVKAREVMGPNTKITAIEPMPSNLAQLRWNVPDAEIFSVAVGEHYGQGRMFGDGMTAELDPRGETPVTVLAIDDLCLQPTFIKVHLEGGEFAALRGAARTLAEARPIVVAGIYHNEDGLWRTPDWLMRTLNNYRFLFRLYCWCGCGAVIYAIPNERGGTT